LISSAFDVHGIGIARPIVLGTGCRMACLVSLSHLIS